MDFLEWDFFAMDIFADDEENRRDEFLLTLTLGKVLSLTFSL